MSSDNSKRPATKQGERRVRLLAPYTIDSNVALVGSVLDLPEQEAHRLESSRRAVHSPGATPSHHINRGATKRTLSRVPPQTEAEDVEPEDNNPRGPDLPLDVNAAPAEDLAQVEGIDEDKAKAIVAHRDKNGPFTSIAVDGDDKGLTAIKGIGKATAEKLADGALVAKQPEPPALLNVNEATAEQLQEIGGIGEEIAEAIVNHVKGNAPFTSIAKTEDDDGLVVISGIAEETAQELSEHLTV